MKRGSLQQISVLETESHSLAVLDHSFTTIYLFPNFLWTKLIEKNVRLDRQLVLLHDSFLSCGNNSRQKLAFWSMKTLVQSPCGIPSCHMDTPSKIQLFSHLYHQAKKMSTGLIASECYQMELDRFLFSIPKFYFIISHIQEVSRVVKTIHFYSIVYMPVTSGRSLCSLLISQFLT